MKKLISILSFTIAAALLIVSGCSKDEDTIPPTISYKQDAGYVSSNTGAGYGDTLVFGIIAKSNGTDKLVSFRIEANGEQLLDSTINTQDFTIDFYMVKSVQEKEVWKFTATDIAGNSKTDSIIITGNFGDILTYNSITLGAQNNIYARGFLSLSNGTSTLLYSQDEAFNNQPYIDMFCFYENTAENINLMSLAGPGSNITGIFSGATSPENYTTKNIIFLVKTELTSAQFYTVQNDAVILESFKSNSQLKKANLLKAGEVYSFKLHSGKYGLFNVTSVEGTETGTLRIAVKIQK